MDLGAGRRGVDMGPSAIRMARIHTAFRRLDHQVMDGGNIGVPQIEEQRVVDSDARHSQEIGAVCRQVALATAAVVKADGIPVVLGGDHSLSAGSMAGVQEGRATTGKEPMGLIWFDAHADMNTPKTSPSGNLHGMTLAALLGIEIPGLSEGVGLGLFSPDRVVLVGVRDVDGGEKELLTKLGVASLTMREIDERGMASVIKEAIGIAGPEGKAFGLSLDLDAVDPKEAPGVGTPVPGGMTYREAHLAMEWIADSKALRALDIVEVNPVLDDRNRTARLAVGLAASAMGKRIL